MGLMRICSFPGCFRPVSLDDKYCEKHKAAGLLRDQKRIKDREVRRVHFKGTSSERGYGSKWRALRNRYIAQHPYCVECMKKGIFTMATDVDHIVPHRGDPSLLFDENNLQSLCKSCHSRKTAKEDGGFGRLS